MDLLSSRPIWATYQDQGKPWLPSEILFQKKKNTKATTATMNYPPTTTMNYPYLHYPLLPQNVNEPRRNVNPIGMAMLIWVWEFIKDWIENQTPPYNVQPHNLRLNS